MPAFQCVGRTIDAALSVAGNGITKDLSIALQAALLVGRPAMCIWAYFIVYVAQFLNCSLR